MSTKMNQQNNFQQFSLKLFDHFQIIQVRKKSKIFAMWESSITDQIYFFLYSLNIAALDLHLDSVLYHTVLNLGYLNSCLNPILFGLFNPTYRAAFKRMFCIQRGTKKSTQKSTERTG